MSFAISGEGVNQMKRYETFLDKHCGQPFANIEEDVNGGLVLYEDVKAEIEKLKATKESAADTFNCVVDALSKASPNSITSHMSGEDACMRMIDDMRWAIDQLKETAK